MPFARMTAAVAGAVTGLALLAAGAVQAAAPKPEGSLRIAAWNFGNLHHEAGGSVPGRDLRRTEQDYLWLRHYGTVLDADIVAVQEANSRAAIHRVFPRWRYQAFISGRRAQDLDAYDLTGRWPDAAIYTGFAVRRGLEVVRVESVPELEIMHTDPRDGTRRPTRWAVELEIEHEGRRMVFLSVHMKSGCWQGDLKDARNGPDSFVSERDADCTTLARQVAPLKAWIDRQVDSGTPFAIMGDFNRRFDIGGAQDHLWSELMAGRDARVLTRYPSGQQSECWKDAPPAPYFPVPIDFILLSAEADRLKRRGSYQMHSFDPALAPRYNLISDHCPISVDLRWPEQAAAVLPQAPASALGVLPIAVPAWPHDAPLPD